MNKKVLFFSSEKPLPSESQHEAMGRLREMFGDRFTDGENDLDVTSLAHHNYIGLLFAQQDDKQSRVFASELSKIYNKVTDLDEFDLEVIYVSLDDEESKFREFFDEMAAWLAVPFGDEGIEKLKARFLGNLPIPALVVFNHQGIKLSVDGAREASKHGFEVIQKVWSKPKVEPTERNKENKKEELKPDS